MEDLRWILLLVGIVVVVAIYLSGRFESDDWARERKRFHDGKLKKSIQKAHRKKTPSAPARFVEKQEPSISSLAQSSVSEAKAEPTVEPRAEAKAEPSTQLKAESNIKSASAPVLEAAQSADAVPEKSLPEQDAPEQGGEASASVSAVEEEQKTEFASVAESVEASKVEVEPAPELETTQTRSTEERVAESVDVNDEQSSNAELTIEAKADDSVDIKFDTEIEDEITDIEIPLDLEVAEAQIKINEVVEEPEPVQTKIPLDIEPLVLSVSIVAEDADGFAGDLLKEALEAEGLAHGAMRIFHYYDPKKEDVVESDDAVFSAANLLEPGFFELEKMGDMRTPGLMMFCQLPGPLEGEAALELMLDKGRGLAVRLHGQMCDDKRNVFTAQAKTYYLDKISAFNREVELARKKAKA